MLNKVVLIGRLGADPDTRVLSTGQTVCNFRLAVQRNFSDRNGERGTDWIPIVVWGRSAENCGRYLAKGSVCAVSGRIQTRSYERNDGQRTYVTEVVADEVTFLPSGSRNQNQGGGYQQNYQQSQPQQDNEFGVPMDGFTEIDDDNMPF